MPEPTASTITRPPGRAALPIFPNYTQVPRRVSIVQWRYTRLAVFVGGLGVIALLFVVPEVGLDLFWGIAVPVLPAVWVVAPGVWRNICPLAAANQTPRLFSFSKARTAPAWVAEYGFLVAIGLFVALASSRKWLFNDSGPATGVLLLVCLGAALLGGRYFKGKSGWCSTVCPLLPIQRLYGQNPVVVSPNSHCEPCLGCAKNCTDFNPHVAFLADQYDGDRTYQLRRRLFSAAFPGFILAFYLLPDPPEISVAELYAGFALGIGLSIGAFFVLDAVFRLRVARLTTVFAAGAFALYYWFTVPSTLTRFDVHLPVLVWVARGVVVALALVWAVRTFRKEGRFVEVALGSRGAPKAGAGIAKASAAASGSEASSGEVLFTHPDREDATRVVAAEGDTLLELAEHNGLPIEAGCRLGACGADPVTVLSGMDSLCEVSPDEAATLDRLGHGPRTRMACVSRLVGSGGCEVKLVPEAGDPSAAAAPPPFEVSSDVRRVVVIGTGIAGVTAADYLRRFSPDCEISLVGREPHLLYNRMGIGRLVYGRSAMSGLYLQDEKWYEDRRFDLWENTEAVRVDRDAKQVVLGTGETIGYDRLILATGSDSRVPPVPGVAGTGTFVLRTADDAIRVRQWAQRPDVTDVVVAGGGLLGLEAAYALTKINVKVTVLERSEHLLRRQLDPGAAALLTTFLANLGIEIVPGADLAHVHRDDTGEITGLELADGRRLPAGLLLVAAGIVPTTSLAAQAGLAVRGGIVVDAQMRTDDPDVFAVGDCAELDGRVAGLWPASAKQAEVAARNALGDAQPFVPQPPVTMLKVVGVDLASMGRVLPADGEEEIIDADPVEGRYRKLVIDASGRVVGGIALGHPKDTPALTRAVADGIPIAPIRDRLDRGDWSALAST